MVVERGDKVDMSIVFVEIYRSVGLLCLSWSLTTFYRVSDSTKHLSGLYNRTRQRIVNLAEDVDDSIGKQKKVQIFYLVPYIWRCTGPKDIVEAIDLDNKFKWRTASKLQRWYRKNRDATIRFEEEEEDVEMEVGLSVGLGAAGKMPLAVTCADLVEEFRGSLQANFPQHFLGSRAEMIDAISSQLDALEAAFDPRVPYWPAAQWTRCIMRNNVRLFYHCSERAVLGW